MQDAVRMNDGSSYYGRPIIKEPTWTWEIPVYLFTGGLGGAASVLSLAARATGRPRLARAALFAGAAGDALSPPLLISDLGRPMRFLNMLRVVKPTSPMNMGSWILFVSGGASTTSAILELSRRLPRVKLASEIVAAASGPALATYTGVLFADTAVPAWHEARRHLPVLFGLSGAASAGAASALFTPVREAGPARRLAIAGTVAELAVFRAMAGRLGFLADPYRSGTAGRLTRAAKGLSIAGSAVLALRGRRSRAGAVIGGALVLAGEMCLRWAVYTAGFASARDPRFTVESQRRRMREREMEERASAFAPPAPARREPPAAQEPRVPTSSRTEPGRGAGST